ncbi:MAG: cytosine permease [Solirubrobacterales bacterium]|nr:cytosine permease [Solirubrobacterales bacterium]
MTSAEHEIDEGTASYGTSITQTEPYGTEIIPLGERHGHPSQQFTLWFAANMVLAVLVSGFFSSLFGLSVVQGLTAVAVGAGLSATVMGLLAGIGTTLGVPQQIQGRGPMGYFANFVPITLLTIVSAIGWTAVNTVFAVIAMRELVGIPFWMGAALMFAVQGLFAIWGYNLVHLMNKIASVVLAILFAIITVLSLSEATFSGGVNPDAPMYMGAVAGWVTFMGFFFAYVMTWTPFASDFSRYLPAKTSDTAVLVYTALGTFVAMMWLGGIGVLVSSFAGDLGPVEAVNELTGGFGPVAMFTVVISTLPVSAMNLYGGSLSVLTIKIPVSRITAVILVSLAGFFATLLMQEDPYGSFYNFLNVLAYLVVPFSTVLLVDYYLRMRRDPTESAIALFDTKLRIQWGFFAMVAGWIASFLFWNTDLVSGPFASVTETTGDIGYYIGAVVALIAYLILLRLRPLPEIFGWTDGKKKTPEPAAGEPSPEPAGQPAAIEGDPS